ncbi:Uncharacterised protein [Mycobacteroides abscessus subsp. abscessus]|nr:Uncharacterised protein [Mycobacteroides abscessus subsp. abscessus]
MPSVHWMSVAVHRNPLSRRLGLMNGSGLSNTIRNVPSGTVRRRFNGRRISC